MEQDQDVYRNWVVAVSDGRTYMGCLAERTENHVVLDDAFELKVMELRRPDPTGRGVEVVLQNMHVQEPLCTGGVSMELYVTKLRYFSAMDPVDLLEHQKFVESAKRQFTAQRARAAGIELVGSA